VDENPVHLLIKADNNINSACFSFAGLLNTYRADTIFTTSQQKPHAVTYIQFPVALGNLQKPAFRN
jgi:hypothetical protein